MTGARKIIFYGGRQAGMVALLTLMALGYKIACVIPVDALVEKIAKNLKLNIKKPKDLNDKKFVKYLKDLKSDCLVCCQGRKILKEEILEIPAVNLHICLYKYPGADPIGRMLKEGNKKASVASHWMTPEVDRGKIIIEKFKEVEGSSPVDIYNELYPLYAEVLIETLRIIDKRK